MMSSCEHVRGNQDGRRRSGWLDQISWDLLTSSHWFLIRPRKRLCGVPKTLYIVHGPTVLPKSTKCQQWTLSKMFLRLLRLLCSVVLK